MVGGCTFLHEIIDQTCIEPSGYTNLLSPNVNTFSSVLEADHLECFSSGELAPMRSLIRSSSSFGALLEDQVMEADPKSKRVKLYMVEDRGGSSDGQQKVVVSHIAVERNRRKQMNDHLNVLRELMPCFYVKRADQASMIGGVVDYITELQQVLQSLEAKKQRKAYSELVLSPRLVSSPGTFAISPQKPGFVSPRPSLPTSPSTPQSSIRSPYRPMLGPFASPSLDPSPAVSFTNSNSGNELVASLIRSAVAEVEVKFVSGNLLLRTACSNRIRGQATKVIAVLELLSLEVLHVNISVVDEAMVNSFTIKIGVGCQLSAQELAEHIQQTFC